MNRATIRRSSAPIVPFTQRFAGALFLQRSLYDYAAATPTATAQAIAVVCFAGMVQPSTLTKELGAWGLIITMLFALLRWFVFATCIAYPTARLFARRPIEYRRLLRCLGFAEAPGILNLFAYLSNEPLPEWTNVVLWVWLLAASIVAIRSAVTVTTARAAVIGVVAFLIYLGLGIINQLVIVFPSP
jgi:hypothetical protein